MQTVIHIKSKLQAESRIKRFIFFTHAHAAIHHNNQQMAAES